MFYLLVIILYLVVFSVDRNVLPFLFTSYFRMRIPLNEQGFFYYEAMIRTSDFDCRDRNKCYSVGQFDFLVLCLKNITVVAATDWQSKSKLSCLLCFLPN